MFNNTIKDMLRVLEGVQGQREEIEVIEEINEEADELEDVENDNFDENMNFEFDSLDNSSLSYEGKKLYLRLNDGKSKGEANKYRLKTSWNVLKDTFPSLIMDEDIETSFMELIANVLVEGVTNTVYFTNLSFSGTNGYITQILSMRLAKDGMFLNEALPEGVTLAFKGHVYAGVFVIDEIRTTSDTQHLEYEVEANVIPYYENIPEGRKDDFLKEIINKATSLTQYTEERLEAWENYLKWRREIARRQIVGMKYIHVDFDYEKSKLLFWVVSENEGEFKKFKKYLRRGVQAFTNEYSQDEWHFKLREETDKRRIRDKSVEMGRYRFISEQFYLSEKSLQESIPFDEYQSEENVIHTIEEQILAEYEEPFVSIVAFELDDKYADEITEKDFDSLELEDFIQNEVLSSYSNEGFLALSAVGDFVLISRLEWAIKQLKRDESYNPNLAVWLFDIQRARLPETQEVEPISMWLNEDIQNNIHQRTAVEKMLNAPDICLIQGPPGTGKTTVIAEAIYQFARNGQRVLIASQSNDAVDNALDRLKDNSAIRAIRLGRNGRRARKNKNNLMMKFTEDQAMDYFYGSLSDQISEDWINTWENVEKLNAEYLTDLRDLKNDVEDIESLNNRIDKKKIELDPVLSDIKNINIKLKSCEEEKAKSNNEINQVDKLLTYMKSETYVPFVLSNVQLRIMFEYLTPVIEMCDRYGVKLLSDLSIKGGRSSIQATNDNLRNTLDRIFRFLNLSEKLNDFNYCDDVENEEIAALEHQVKMLSKELDQLDIDDAPDEVYAKVRKEKKKVLKQISELKNNSTGMTLSQAEKDLCEDKLLKLFESGHIEDVNSSFVQVKLIVEGFMSEIETISRKLKEATIPTEVKMIPQLEINLEKLKTQEARIRLDIEEISNIAATRESRITELASKYNTNRQIEELQNSIERAYKENEQMLKDIAELKNDWGNILIDFKDKLDDSKQLEYDKEYYQDVYINACNVVGISCTDNMRALSDKGYHEFDVVIIDEVSKATPPELLIPLMKARKTILVGDHRQLPPLFNEHEKSYKEIVDTIEEVDEEISDLMTLDNFKNYKDMVTASLFKNYFEQADESVKHSLFTQYRMHSNIMDIINRFYEGYLEAGFSKDIEGDVKKHNLKIPGLKGQKFIREDKHAYWLDSSKLPNGKPFYESRPKGSTSTENILECYMIIELLKKIANEYAQMGHSKTNPKTIGVISFYQLQVNRLRAMLKKERRTFDFSSIRIDINTVDRFQGKEKEIIITSLVRNPEKKRRHENSHIAAFERINVAFSRAQNLLIIVGSKDMYSDQPVKLPKMDSVGEKTVYVYRNIVEELNRNACFFGANRLVDEGIVSKIDEFFEREYGGNQ